MLQKMFKQSVNTFSVVLCIEWADGNISCFSRLQPFLLHLVCYYQYPISLVKLFHLVVLQ